MIPLTKPNIPSWVQSSSFAQQPVMQKLNSAMQNLLPDSNQIAQPLTAQPSVQNSNVGKIHNAPSNWDGLGTNPDDQSGQHNGNDLSNIMNKLPPQLQQFLQMFQNGGQLPQGFQGLQPVEHSPWGQDASGANINPWGQNQNAGIYGGT